MVLFLPTNKFLFEHSECAIQRDVYSTLCDNSAMNVRIFVLIQKQKAIRHIQMKGGLQFYRLMIIQQ